MRTNDSFRVVLVGGPFDLTKTMTRYRDLYIKMYTRIAPRTLSAETMHKPVEATEILYKLVATTPSGTLIYEYEGEAA